MENTFVKDAMARGRPGGTIASTTIAASDVPLNSCLPSFLLFPPLTAQMRHSLVPASRRLLLCWRPDPGLRLLAMARRCQQHSGHQGHALHVRLSGANAILSSASRRDHNDVEDTSVKLGEPGALPLGGRGNCLGQPVRNSMRRCRGQTWLAGRRWPDGAHRYVKSFAPRGSVLDRALERRRFILQASWHARGGAHSNLAVWCCSIALLDNDCLQLQHEVAVTSPLAPPVASPHRFVFLCMNMVCVCVGTRGNRVDARPGEA